MNYDTILDQVLICGTHTSNRTGVHTRQIPAAMFEHRGYTHEGKPSFPAITKRKLQYKAVVAELLGFLNGYSSASDFRQLGANIWDANANKNEAWLNNPNRICDDDMGRVYGVQWRSWKGLAAFGQKSLNVDQILSTLRTLERSPDSRRMLVSAWQPAELDQMCLPPCHFAFQLIVDGEHLHLNWYQRSVDVALGLPFNIASYATLQHLIAKVFDYKVGTLSGLLSNVHVYENHLQGIKEYLHRNLDYKLPSLQITLPFERAEGETRADYFMRLLPCLTTQHFLLENYQHGAHISMEMVV